MHLHAGLVPSPNGYKGVTRPEGVTHGAVKRLLVDEPNAGCNRRVIPVSDTLSDTGCSTPGVLPTVHPHKYPICWLGRCLASTLAFCLSAATFSFSFFSFSWFFFDDSSVDDTWVGVIAHTYTYTVVVLVTLI